MVPKNGTDNVWKYNTYKWELWCVNGRDGAYKWEGYCLSGRDGADKWD